VAQKRRSSGTAVVVLDMLNSYAHEEAGKLAANVAEAIDGLRTLLQRAREEEIPVVYVNDNYGVWNSSPEELAEKALAGRHPELVEPIVPAAGDSFVIKARHSGFYETPLEYLLGQMAVDRIVFAGQVTEQCVLYSALDAYVRHFRPVIATDSVAAIHEDLAGAALRMLERNMGAELTTAAEVSLLS
jgi:nicotinamidase-related amidase